MADIIVGIILILLIGGAVAYIVKEKKKGTKCIGCPAGGSCPHSGKLPKKKLTGMHCARCDSDENISD